MTARLFKDVTAGDVHSPGAMHNQPEPPLRGKKKPKTFAEAMMPASVTLVNTDKRADWSIPVKISKTDDQQFLVFGWANVVEKDGAIVVDQQGDRIEIAELETAVYGYVLEKREAGEMHARTTGVGKLVESIVMTAEKQAAMGLPAGATPLGWWVGYKLAPDVFAKVKDGTYSMFSIGGAGTRVAG